MPAGAIMRVEVLARALVHWSFDGWQTVRDTETHPTGFGAHIADLPTTKLPGGSTVVFTFYWPEAGHWEGTNFEVVVD